MTWKLHIDPAHDILMVFEACKLDKYWPSYRTFILGQKLVKNQEIVGQNREVRRQVKNSTKIGRLPPKSGDLEPLDNIIIVIGYTFGIYEELIMKTFTVNNL